MKKRIIAEIQSFLQTDRAILMFCIGIALIFWLLVKLSQTYKTTREYTIDYIVPESMVLAEPPTETVKVTIAGKGFELISNYFRNRSENEIRFELTEAPEQNFSTGLISDKIQNILPGNIEVSDVNTDFIFLKVEKKVEKKVPVVLNSVLNFAPRFYLIDSISLSTDSVTVSGPNSYIETLRDWPTDTLKLNNIQNSGTHKLPLAKPANAQLVPAFDEVEVMLKVDEFTEKDVFVPIIVKNAPDSLKIFPENIKLSFTVGLSNYNIVSSADFTVEVDLKDIPLDTEKNTIPVLVANRPTIVHNINVNPKSVEFYFVKTKDVVNTEAQE